MRHVWKQMEWFTFMMLKLENGSTLYLVLLCLFDKAKLLDYGKT